MATTVTKAAREQLRSYLERVERLEEEKKGIGEDIKSVYQEAKAQGFDVKALRAIVRLRKIDTNERAEQEAILTTYMHALGMAEAPLFAAVGAMAVDTAARDQVIEAFKQIVPSAGEVIIKMGGAPVRLYRDKDGKARAEDYVEEAETKPAVRPGKTLKTPATVLTMVPKGGPSAEDIKRIADEAERTSDQKREKEKQPEPEGTA